MSQEKAQLIAPQGHFTVPGLNVAGVVTASSFSGNCTGTASSIAQGTNVVVGVMTASSFAGDVFGNAAGLSTTTAGLKLGIVTATSFAGNFTGIGSGLTGTPNIVAGLVTASQFVGNTPGLAAGISAGKNLAAGIVTATTFYGDGSNLTGAGSTAFIRQTVGSGTTIDLNNGNIINLLHIGNSTVSFANTSTADDVTIIRPLDLASEAFTSGAVAFDGTDDRLTLASSSDLAMGTDDFTIEMWVTKDNDGPDGTYQISATTGGLDTTIGGPGLAYHNNDGNKGWQLLAAGGHTDVTYPITTGVWYHIAHVRTGGSSKLYVNGDLILTKSDTTDYSTSNLCIGGYYDTSYLWNGKISNFRVVKGTALYTSNFTPNFAALTNVTNTKLLCCQDTSSTTVGAVKPGTITAVGDPTASSNSIYPGVSSTLTWPSSITWNGGSPPTLLAANSYSLTGQVFNLVTADGGSTWYGYEEVNNDNEAPQELWTWGENDYGFLGLNDITQRSSPTQVGSDTNWDKDSLNKTNNYGPGNGSSVWKNDGTIWVWGYNGYGEAGYNNTVQYSSPVQFPGTTWAMYAQGDTMAVATKTDGTLWSWGRSSYGGRANNVGPANNVSSPIQIGSGTDWATGTGKITADAYGGGAIKTDGTMWTWGRNLVGSLGDNSNTNRSSPVQVPGTTWDKFVQNYGCAAALKTDGTLWAWASNTSGNLGQNSTSPAYYSSPTQIPGTTWSHVSGKQNSWMLGIKTDGTMWAWGSNNYGALGLNESAPAKKSSPTQIPGTTWSKCFSTSTGNTALKTDGTVWVWGQDGGNLGQNTNITRRSSPTQVPGTDWEGIIDIGNRSVGGFRQP